MSHLSTVAVDHSVMVRTTDGPQIAGSAPLRRLRAFVRYTHRGESGADNHAPGRLAMTRTSLDV